MRLAPAWQSQAVNPANTVGGHYGGHYQSRMIDKMLGHLGDHLDLSDSQRSQLEEIKVDNIESMKALKQGRREIRTDSLALDPASENYDVAVSAIADRHADLARQTALMMGAGLQRG